MLAVSLYSRLRRDISAAYDRLEQTPVERVTTAHGPIEVAIRGEGPPALALHGIVGGYDQGLLFANGHLRDDYRLIAPSRFGYLGSTTPDEPSILDQAQAYADLLDALAIDRTVVLATSAGATSALAFSLEHPERCTALVLVAPNAPGEVDVAPPPRPIANVLYHSDFLFWLMTAHFRSSLTSMMGVPKGFPMTPDHEAAVDQVIDTVLPAAPRADGALFDLYVSNPAVHALPLDKIDVPVLIVNALDDPLTLLRNAEAMAACLSNARLVTIPDGGHMMLGHNEVVRAEIASFLGETASQEAGR